MRAAPLDVAEAAREAGASFLIGVRSGWGKAQLAAWLIGPYKHATSYAGTGTEVVAGTSGGRGEESREETHAAGNGSGPALTPGSMRAPDSAPVTVAPESLDDVIFRARQEIVESLDATVYGRSKPQFVEDAIALGSVTPFVWMPGVRGWAPRDRPRLRLRDRVLALFAADYLTRPETYARELYVCPDCMCAVFDENAVGRAKCPLHDRPSGIRHPPKTLDERVDELLAASAESDAAYEAAAGAAGVSVAEGVDGADEEPISEANFDFDDASVAPGSYRFVAGEPYTAVELGPDANPSEPVILLKRRIKTA